jgi:hypothetical protein
LVLTKRKMFSLAGCLAVVVTCHSPHSANN